jgi:hypothetical protein
MKPTKLIPTLAITAALALTACGSNDEGQAPEQDPAPQKTQATPEAQDALTEEDPTQQQVTPDEEYQATLDDLGNPLPESDRYAMGYQACIYMLTDAQGAGTDVFLDEITRDNISLGHTYVGVELAREDVDEPNTSEVTRAAIEYICPEVKDKMTDDAWSHNTFRQDHIEGNVN